jgi:MoaA/NifB/PqqE/SkfB family radical SAM enzyme
VTVVSLGDSSEVRPWVGPRGQMMRRLEMHITYTCPERCTFCSEEDRMASYKQFGVSFARVATVLRKHARRGVSNVHFTGGEPTIHPRFLDILRLAKKLRMRTSMGTIGTMIARPDFAEKAVPLLDEALFSLHGPDAATHDALARRPGSFDTVTTAIRTAKRLRPDFGVFVNTVATRQNLDALPATVALAGELGAALVVVSNTTPEGGGLTHYEDLAPTLEHLGRILPLVPEAAPGVVIRFFGVPMCLLGEHWSLSNDLHWDPRVTAEWATEPGKVVFEDFYNWAPDRKRVHTEECAGCARKSLCTGVFDRYAELWPTERLQPFAE